MKQAEGQISFFDPPIKPGTYVNDHGKRLNFSEIAERVGKLIVIDVSTESRTHYQAVLVERIIFNSDAACRRLIYYNGKKQRGLVNEYYFDPDRRNPVKAYEFKEETA